VGVIGAQLKLLLISKLVVFVGFSFSDEDFKKIYQLLNKDIGDLMPVSFLVTIDEQAGVQLEKLHINAIPIVTSASFFVKKLKEELVKEGAMLPELKFEGLKEALENLYQAHNKVCALKSKEHPDALYCQWYQDGLKHAFERLIATKRSGENSCASHMINLVDSYESVIKENLRNRDYPEVAYFKGYQTGMIYFLSEEKDREFCPFYFLFGLGDLLTFEEFIKAEKEASEVHKSAHKLVVELCKTMKDNHVLHRRPL
jgi:hypothetical protein